MKASYKLLFAFAIMVVCSHGKAWAAICPVTSNTNTDCGYIFTIGPGGTLTGAAVMGANPYDGNDDSLIGVVNNSGSVYSGSFTLSGSGNGGGIFGFDGDGICTFTFASYCTPTNAPTGYEGLNMFFSNISAGNTMGTVNFNGIAVGGSDFFSLEGSPSSINPVPITATPEPSSLLLLATGALSAGAGLRRKLMAKH